jgi:hypothetical protein
LTSFLKWRVLLLEIPGRSNRDNWPVQLRNDSAKDEAYQNAAKMEGFETSGEAAYCWWIFPADSI